MGPPYGISTFIRRDTRSLSLPPRHFQKHQPKLSFPPFVPHLMYQAGILCSWQILAFTLEKKDEGTYSTIHCMCTKKSSREHTARWMEAAYNRKRGLRMKPTLPASWSGLPTSRTVCCWSRSRPMGFRHGTPDRLRQSLRHTLLLRSTEF